MIDGDFDTKTRLQIALTFPKIFLQVLQTRPLIG